MTNSIKVNTKQVVLKARSILNSRGHPTVEVDLHYKDRVFRSSVPSGASKGKKEKLELLDGNPEKFGGASVDNAVVNAYTLHEKLQKQGVIVTNIKELDDILVGMDGTEQLVTYGANAILALSMAYCRLLAEEAKLPLYEYISEVSQNKKCLPRGYYNVLNGGKHSSNRILVQELMVSPKGASFAEEYGKAGMFYLKLKELLSRKGYSTNVGDEGGFAPDLDCIEDGMDIVEEIISGEKGWAVGFDFAANEMWDEDRKMYRAECRNGADCLRTTDKQVEYYLSLQEKYPIVNSMEDPFEESDFLGWQKLCAAGSLRIVGDDLVCTNAVYIKEAAAGKMCNTVLVKLNQIGTISGALLAIETARSNGMEIMVSHRSAETEDTFVAHFAVGVGAEYVKFGAPCRSERTAKYNELLRIEEDMCLNSVKH